MALAQLQPPADQAKALGEQVGKLSFTSHAATKGGAVECATPACPQLVEDRLFLAGIVRIEPVAKEGGELVGQSQQDVIRTARPGVDGGLDDLFQFRLVEPGDHGGGEHADRHTGLGQSFDHLDPPNPRAGPGLQLSPQRLIEGGDRHHHLA